MKKSNKTIKVVVSVVAFVLAILLVLGSVKSLTDSQNKLDNNMGNMVNDNQNQESNEQEENEYIPYKTELPEFKDSFEKAMFVYGWFYDIGDLFPYLDQNNLIDEEWYLLKATEFSSIEDMKEYAYEVFNKDFIDKKFAELQKEEEPMFKESKEGILVRSGYVSQYGPYLGYDGNYKKTVNKDGSITYKVTISGSVSSGPTFDSKCNTTYEYKMIKNKNGQLLFNSFEYPTNICLKDMD